MSQLKFYFGKCLTWDPRSPAPYESGWSVLSKILLINHLSGPDLFALIHKEGAEGERSGALDHLHSNWIDLTKLAALLGVEIERLEQCFLDTLGFTIKAGTQLGIRHCPECAQLGYHCVLFNLAMVEFCPWHHRRLAPICAGCLRSIAYSRPKAMRRSLVFSCKKCSLGRMDFRQDLHFDRLPVSLKQEIDAVSTALVTWWELLGQKMPERDVVLSHIGTIGEKPWLDKQWERAMRWQLGYAHRRQPLPTLWSDKIEIPQVTLVSWTEEDELTDSDALTMRQFVPCYKSIRRYLFHRHVQPHRPCYRYLSRISRLDTLALDSGQACSVSLAYLTWRLLFEGVTNIEELRAPHTFSIGLAKKAFLAHPVSPQMLGNLVLYLFYDLWKRIEDNCAHKSFYIEKLGDHSDNEWEVKGEAAVLTSRSMASAAGRKRRWWLLHPDPELLAQQADRRCRHRHHVNAMLSKDFGWLNNQFNYYGEPMQPNRLFKLILKNRRSYDYVMVYRHIPGRLSETTISPIVAPHAGHHA